MASHWNVQISVQEVREPEPMMNSNGYPVKGPMGAELLTERKVIKLADVAVTATTEAEAFAKARRMLDAAEPQGVVAAHVHRASCHGEAGELICGFPK